MKRKNTTRNALFTSIISLLLCVSMLVGTTFAWFTDEVASGMNTITAGNLDVELYHSDRTANGEKVTTETELFDDIELWEPGAVVYENLQVKNEGSLALKYQMALNFTNATKSPKNDRTLADVLKVAVVKGGFTGDREAAKRLDYNYTLSTFALNGELREGQSSETYGIVIYWEPSNNDNDFNMNNDYQGWNVMKIDLGISLFATQLEHENDSFDNTYDAGIVMPDVIAEAPTADAFLEALAAGKVAKLTADLTLDIAPNDAGDRVITIPTGVTSAIDLNGHKLNLGDKGSIDLEGNLIVTGTGEINVSDESNSVYSAFSLLSGATLEIQEGVTMNIADGSTAIIMFGTEGATMNLNGGIINVPSNAYGIMMVNVKDVAVNLNEGKISGEGLGVHLSTYDADMYIGKDVLESTLQVMNSTLNLSYADTLPVIDNHGATVNLTKVASVTNSTELSDAIANAATDCLNVITLADGVYADNINITKAQYGEKEGDLVFKAAPGANPVIAGTVALGYRNQGTGAAMWESNVTFEGITFDHANAANHSISVGDVKSLTLTNCTIIGDGEYGIESARGNGTGNSLISGCTFKDAGMQILGNFGTGLVIDQCTFIDSRINVQGGNGVTVQNCTFDDTLTDANDGDGYYVVRSNDTPITVKNCEINVDSTVTGIGAPGTGKFWGVFVNRGVKDWTVTDVSVTLSDTALAQPELLICNCTKTGKINTTNLTTNALVLKLVNGYNGLYTDGTNYYVYDAEGLISMRNFWNANSYGNNMWGRSYNVMADINATGYTWDEVWVNVGNNDNNGFVFDGHGHTITGLNINGGLFSGTPNGGNKPNNPGYVKDITFDGVNVTGDHFAGVLWSNVYNELVVENVAVINSTITGKCNVGALVGATVTEGGDATVKFINCVVKNNVITAEGKAGQDPTGASAYVGRAYGDSAVKFVGTNIAEGNAITNKNGLVGGGIYAYTIHNGTDWVNTGKSDTFTNWGGVVISAIKDVPGKPYEGELIDEGTDSLAKQGAQLEGDATTYLDRTYGTVVYENVTANLNGHAFVVSCDNTIIIYDCNFTLPEGAKLITTTDGATVGQVMMYNVTVNGELLTQATAAQYLEGVNWYEVL